MAIYCARHGLDQDAQLIAVELWTFVHGASCLVIDGDYAKVAPGLDIDNLIAQATPKMLGVKPLARQR